MPCALGGLLGPVHSPALTGLLLQPLLLLHCYPLSWRPPLLWCPCTWEKQSQLRSATTILTALSPPITKGACTPGEGVEPAQKYCSKPTAWAMLPTREKPNSLRAPTPDLQAQPTASHRAVTTIEPKRNHSLHLALVLALMTPALPSPKTASASTPQEKTA